MKIGFFFWPFNVEMTETMARHADTYGYDMIGVADTAGNAMDPWVAAALVARLNKTSESSICVSNFVTRDPAVSAAAIASLDLVAPGRAVLGIGAGHSGTRNLGAGKSTVREMAEQVAFTRKLLRAEEVKVGGGVAQMPWIKRPSKVFMAASHPKALEASGRVADGVFINYGLQAELVADSERIVTDGTRSANRSSDEVEIWQIAGLACHEDGDRIRQQAGAGLAFGAGYVIGDKDPLTRSSWGGFRNTDRMLRAGARGEGGRGEAADVFCWRQLERRLWSGRGRSAVRRASAPADSRARELNDPLALTARMVISHDRERLDLRPVE